MSTKLLTLDEVAGRYGIPVATLRYWRHKGEGPPSARIGRRVVYREAECEAWVQQQFAAEARQVPA
jgi:predicted DNA-binding transcriptional regulator AlpA